MRCACSPKKTCSAQRDRRELEHELELLTLLKIEKEGDCNCCTRRALMSLASARHVHDLPAFVGIHAESHRSTKSLVFLFLSSLILFLATFRSIRLMEPPMPFSLSDDFSSWMDEWTRAAPSLQHACVHLLVGRRRARRVRND